MINSSVCITKYRGLDIAWLDTDSKMQLLSVSDESKDIVGDIYVGVVKHVMKNLNACFVEFLEDKLGFLSFNDVYDDFRIVEGQNVVVQVVKEASKNKEAVLTMKFGLAGNYCIVEKSNTGLSISRKITGDKRGYIRESLSYNSHYSVIVRTNAELLEDLTILENEIKSLSEMLSEIEANASTRTKYTRVYKALPEYVRFIKGLDKRLYQRVITDNEEMFANLKDIDAVFYNDDYSFAKLHSLETKLNEILGKCIWLKGGGNIFIEYTEAMTVIDVNSAKNVSNKDREAVILKTNIEAAMEIARQIRLRNISGIIVIDFINMKETENINILIDTVKKSIKEDTVRCDFVEYTKLGLVHLVRRKIKPPVYEYFV